MTTLISKSAIAVLALCVVMPATATMASAKVCKNYSVSANGGKKWTNLSARLSARTEWRKKVRKQLSIRWSLYARAKNKGYSCHRTGLKWRCSAYGRPCRPGN